MKPKQLAKCIRHGCEVEFQTIPGVIKLYCSKKCRYLARGSKKGKKRALK